MSSPQLAAETPAPVEERSRYLSDAEWKEAVFLFETGKSTKTDLSRRFGISWQAVSKGLKQRGAIYGSKSSIITDSLIEAEKTDSARKAEEITAMRERQRVSIELLQKIQNNIVGTQIRDNLPLSEKIDDIKALNLLIKNQTMIREDLWRIYDLDRDPDQAEEFPDFVVSEYEPEELRAINEKTFGKSADETLDDLATSIDLDMGD